MTIDITAAGRRSLLTDCPYCDGEGTVPTSALGICVRCHGTGRMAHFLAERVIARRAGKSRQTPDGIQPDDVRPDFPLS